MGHRVLTAPSNANTSGLEVVAWLTTGGDVTRSEAYAREQSVNDPENYPVTLVTAASAQARIAELEADLSKVIAQRDSHWDEYIAERQSRMEHGAREAGYLDTIPKLTDRATAAEARADRLAKALRKSREGWANALELSLLPPQHEETARDLRDEADAALQQETQK